MPKRDAHSPHRRIMMQVIVWLVFGGSLGIAAVASRFRADSLTLVKTVPARIDKLSFDLPAGWQHEIASPGEVGDQLVVHEPLEPPLVRKLSVVVIDDRDVRGQPEMNAPPGPPVRITQSQDIVIAAYKATLQVFTRSIAPDFDAAGLYDTEVIAVAELAGGDMLRIKLRRRPAQDKQELEDDIALVKQICRSVKIESQ